MITITQLPFGTRLSLALLATCALGAGPAPRVFAQTVTVNATSVVSDVSANPLGINVNYLMDDDSARARDRSLAAALSEMKVRYVRYPGGEKSDNYLWSVSPFTAPNIKAARVNAWPASDPRFFSNGVDGRARLLDFDEFITMSQTAGTEPVMVVAFDSMYKAASGNETPPTKQQLKQTAVEWVRYANVTKGYGVKYWTLGNETDYAPSYAGSNPGATTYANDVVEFAQAMRAVDPTIKIGINGQSLTWFRSVLAIAKDHVDYLEVHTYPFWNFANYAQYQSSAGNYTGDVVGKAIAAINELAAPYRDRMFATLTETNAIPFGGAWPNVNDMGHAVAVFDIFGQHLEVDKLKFMMLWNTRWVDNGLAAAVGQAVGTGPSLLSAGDNPGFESGSTGWNLVSGATIVTDAYAGTKAMRTVNASADVLVTKNLSPALFQAGVSYDLSFWAKKTAGAGWVGAGVDFYKNGVKVIGESAEVTTSSYARAHVACMAPEEFDAVQVWTFTTAGTTAVFDEFAIAEPRETPTAFDAIDRKGNTYATGQALGIWGKFLKEKMVAVSGETTAVRAYATKDAVGSLSVAILNKAGTAATVTVSLQNHGGLTTGERWQLAGTGPNDIAPVWSNTGSVSVVSNAVTVTVPAVSITVLDLKKNLLANPGFESGLTSWSNWSNSAVVTGHARTGVNAIRVGTGAGGRAQVVTALLLPNTTYRLSGFGKMGNGTDAGWLGVEIKQGGTLLLKQAHQFIGTSYQRGEVTFTTPASFDYAVVWVWKDAGSSYLWADDLVLTR